MNLQTYTPATGLSQGPGKRWIVRTARGDIQTTSVVVATNAFTASFLPEFNGLIYPIRGTACSITPAPNYQPGGAFGRLRYSYGFRHTTGDVDYLIPRQGRGGISGHGDQSIILGGAKSCYLEHIDRWYDNINDDQLMPGVKEYFEGFMKKKFIGWDGNAHGNVDRVWSGGTCLDQSFTLASPGETERYHLARLTYQFSATQKTSHRGSASIPIARECLSAPA